MSDADALARLLGERPDLALTFGLPQAAVRGRVESLLPALTPARRAGLWLAFDFEAEAHAIAQDLHTPDGSLWHAIIHRREPDAWNSKYWYRQAGDHPVLRALADACPALGYDWRGPAAFVDFCARAAGGADEKLARRVQAAEWELLFG